MHVIMRSRIPLRTRAGCERAPFLMDAQTFQQFIAGTELGASSEIQDVCMFTCAIRKEKPKLSKEAKCVLEPLQRGIQWGFGSAIDVYLGFVVNPWPQGLWQP